jgi:cytochrome c oxidase subunit 2
MRCYCLTHEAQAFYSECVNSLWMPPDGAFHGPATDRLMTANLAAIAILFLLAQFLIVIPFFQRNKKRLPVFWITELLPLGLLCGLYIWMAFSAQRLWAAGRFEGPSPTAMQVEVVGVQFQWYFRYPGEDATFGATRPELINAGAGNPLGLDSADGQGHDDIVSSELVLPAGREVDVRLRAHDVIHGFFIPGMRLKENAVPGLTLHVHFTPVTPGQYPILCSQVCGLGHGHMEALLRVLPPEQFDTWLTERERRRLAEQTTPGGGA